MPKKQKPHQLLVEGKKLLVEGKNDQHVIWALCNQYQLPKTFSVEVAEEDGTASIETLLAGLPARLDEQNLQTLGIVVDADSDLAARWQAIRDKLMKSRYENIPQMPPAEGWVYAVPDLTKVGVWLMPNNQLSEMLENFVAQLIPFDDVLHPKAEAVLQEIEHECLNCYASIHRPKALIHTWLAWQKTPGMPMGQAITAQVLSHDSPLALTFVEWLQRLFELPTT